MSITYYNCQPTFGENVYLARGAIVTGAVEIGPDSSIWFNSVVRGDVDRIFIGTISNVQDLTMIHVTEGFPTRVGNMVTIGHSCTIHGCTIGDETLIGMGSVLCDGAVIGRNCLIGAGSLIPQGKHYPDGVLILGSPARVIRKLGERDIASIRSSALRYKMYAGQYRKLNDG